MKNRTSITPWPAVGDGADSVGFCETWRVWEAGTTSEFLNWFLFTPHARSTTAEAAVVEDWIYFQDGSSELDDRARAILGHRVKLLRTNPAIRIVIGGLCGRPGTIADGMKLGLKRVMSIRTFLLAAGIDPGRIGTAVRGSGWSVAERFGGSEDSTSRGTECRLQVTDSLWTLARN